MKGSLGSVSWPRLPLCWVCSSWHILYSSSRAVSAGPVMFMCCRLEMEQGSLVSGVWCDLLSYLMNDWWHLTHSTFADKCCLLHWWSSMIFAWLCIYTGVLNSFIFIQWPNLHMQGLLPPCETLLSLQHQHWSVDFEWVSTQRGKCNSWIWS